MTITLSNGVSTATLPADLLWTDEYTWAAVEQTVERSVTGALLVQAGSRVAGRPITLAASDSSSGWTTRTTVEQLRTWAGIAGQELTLSLHGISRTVIFRHQDGAFEATAVADFSDPLPDDPYHLTVRLTEI